MGQSGEHHSKFNWIKIKKQIHYLYPLSVFFFMQGKGIIFDETANKKDDIYKDKMVFITPETLFSFITLEDELTLLGGPCPFDENILSIGD